MVNKRLIEKHITTDPAVQHGRPCIKATRIPVHVVLEALACGMPFEEVVREYAPITMEDIHACLLFAAMLTDEQELIKQPS